MNKSFIAIDVRQLPKGGSERHFGHILSANSARGILGKAEDEQAREFCSNGAFHSIKTGSVYIPLDCEPDHRGCIPVLCGTFVRAGKLLFDYRLLSDLDCIFNNRPTFLLAIKG